MTDKTERPSTVVEAINLVQEAFARTGVAKTERNKQQGYNFRTIDDMYGILNPALREAGLAILPTVNDIQYGKFTTSKGAVLNHTVIQMQYRVQHFAGESLTVLTIGEAMDSGDKAVPKAQTAAFKTALVQLFSIPFAGEPEADAESPGDAGEQIDQNQLNRLLAIIEANAFEMPKLLKYYKVDSLEHIQKTAFNGVLSELELMAERKAKRAEK